MTFEQNLEAHRERLRVKVRVLISRAPKTEDFAEAVEDAVQQTLIDAWKGRKTYNPDKPLFTWLCAIAINVCNQRGRDAQRRLPANQLDTALELEDLSPSPESDVLEDDGNRVAINQAIVIAMSINSVTQRRLALLLAAEISIPRISEVMGLPVAAVYKRIHRLLKTIDNERTTRTPNAAGTSELPAGTSAGATGPKVANPVTGGKEQPGAEIVRTDRRFDQSSRRSPKVQMGSDKEAPRHRRIDYFDDVRGRDEALCVPAA